MGSSAYPLSGDIVALCDHGRAVFAEGKIWKRLFMSSISIQNIQELHLREREWVRTNLHEFGEHPLCSFFSMAGSMIGVAHQEVVGAELVDDCDIALHPVLLEILRNNGFVLLLKRHIEGLIKWTGLWND